ncbi:MAG: NAD-dependent epimerase/dehydratase family protein [Candidatus Aminicenantales bacterium]
MRILVTGATGFVGSVLMPELMKKFGPESLSAFVLPGEEIPDTWSGHGIRLFDGDIADREAVFAACRGHSHVIHLAGLISYWKYDLEKLMKVNRDGVRNVVEACLSFNVRRLIHISSVGAVGFFKNGRPADETTPFNWPSSFYYMTSKYEGQKIVEEAVQGRGLRAIILNPASIMGPGDWNLETPHNQLYRTIHTKTLCGSFAGGLAAVDVRDLAAVIIKALEGGGRLGEKYLVVGANVRYSDVIRRIARHAGRRAYPFPVPSFLVAAAGAVLELISGFTRKKPLLTSAYGRLSGWRAYYSSAKSQKEFAHTYFAFEKTIQDTCLYFQKTFLDLPPMTSSES